MNPAKRLCRFLDVYEGCLRTVSVEKLGGALQGRHSILTYPMVILFGIVYTEVGDNQFSCEPEVVKKILFLFVVLKASWVDILVEGKSVLDSPAHKHKALDVEAVGRISTP